MGEKGKARETVAIFRATGPLGINEFCKRQMRDRSVRNICNRVIRYRGKMKENPG